MKKNKKKIAFWKYDKYPYLLWGEVDEKKGNLDGHCVFVKSYDCFFVPFFVLNEEDGKILSERLSELKHEKEEIDISIRSRYANLANDEINKFVTKHVGILP